MSTPIHRGRPDGAPSFDEEPTWGEAAEEITLSSERTDRVEAPPREGSLPTAVDQVAPVFDEAPPRLPTAALAPLHVVIGRTAARASESLAARMRRRAEDERERRRYRWWFAAGAALLIAAVLLLRG